MNTYVDAYVENFKDLTKQFPISDQPVGYAPAVMLIAAILTAAEMIVNAIESDPSRA